MCIKTKLFLKKKYDILAMLVNILNLPESGSAPG